MLLALGVIALLAAIPLFGFAALGLLGILADVGNDENREIGLQALSMGLPALVSGLVLCAGGLWTLAKNRARTS
ncbi:MAG: hypothetical protein R3B90_20910 [Planctomycetaceae bacterium]